ncbi:hypothetical protein CRI94_03685 [Longibacter salinarum]|uniref:DUF3224 domain-containing protein n=1 Tax=Longibacter salinarum TaxID=1850348 RepID=A0A2A8CZY2_9BACT|nr:DUF3224 domain-containing protein [Longibacter salinarum]PEN14153.1 hypothetical protein CRI94_03685 [Longibacter salinarum]
MIINGDFEIISWDEETYSNVGERAKMTRASVSQSFEGDFEGDGQVEYLMAYSDDTTARFVGQQWISGHVGERTGSVVLQISGTFDGETAQATWTVVDGTGTEDFRGVTGQGGFTAPLGDRAAYTFDLTFPDAGSSDAAAE